MGWFAIKTVWFKELLDTARDKRTLYMMVLLPLVLMPLMMMVGPLLMQRQFAALNESLPAITVVGDETAADLAQWLSDSGALHASYVRDLERTSAQDAVRNEEAELVIYVQGGALTTTDASIPLDIIYESRRSASSDAMHRFESQLQQYSAHIVSNRLTNLGLSPAMLEPFAIDAVQDLTTQEQIGGQILGMILPFLIALWAVMGGMYTAIDVAAGEKERGSMESLIMAPVSRGALVFGKFLAIVTVALTAVILLVFSMLGSILYLLPRVMGADEMVFGFSIEPLAVVLLLLVMVLFIAMAAALLLALSSFGKSFKEGQAYITGLTFAVMLPGMYFMFIDEIAVGLAAYAVPVFNVMLVLRELLEGTINWSHMGVTLGSLALCAGLAMFASFKVFLNERVLFRS